MGDRSDRPGELYIRAYIGKSAAGGAGNGTIVHYSKEKN